MSNAPLTWYPSKVDWWLALALCLPPVAILVVCVLAVLTDATTDLLVSLAAAAFMAAIYRGLVFPVRYGVDDTHLMVRFGLCRRRIPLASIVSVRPSRNPRSSPAMSLDRLCVRYGKGIFNTVLISPADRRGFLDELARKAGLRDDGDGLRRL